MYELKKITPVIRHIQKISPNMYRETGGEIMAHCPYCDDATRKNASNHGHLYFANNSPVFNCFRCDTSGTILKFLIETGFTDAEVMKYIASFIQYRFIKNYSKKSFVSNTNINELYKQNIQRITQFKKNNKENFNIFRNYVIGRIGNVDYNKFLIYPAMIKIKNQEYFCCGFNNSDNEYITSRVIESHPYLRYKNSDENNLYYFQSRDFNKYNQIVITEGVFDIINLYLYSNMFKNCLFMSISGKKYIAELESLLTKCILIGNYQVNLIFDLDFKNPKLTLIKCIRMASHYNQNVIVKGFTPINPFNDTGDFPQVMEI